MAGRNFFLLFVVALLGLVQFCYSAGNYDPTYLDLPTTQSISYNLPATLIGVSTTLNPTSAKLSITDGSIPATCAADPSFIGTAGFTYFLCPAHQFLGAGSMNLTYQAYAGTTAVGGTYVAIVTVTAAVQCLAAVTGGYLIGNYNSQLNEYIVEAGQPATFQLQLYNPLDPSTFVTGTIVWNTASPLVTSNFNCSASSTCTLPPFTYGVGTPAIVTLDIENAVGNSPAENSDTRCVQTSPSTIPQTIHVSAVPIIYAYPTNLTVSVAEPTITVDVETLFADTLKFSVNSGTAQSCTVLFARTSYQCIITVPTSQPSSTVQFVATDNNTSQNASASTLLTIYVENSVAAGFNLNSRPYNTAVKKQNIQHFCSIAKFPGIVPKNSQVTCGD